MLTPGKELGLGNDVCGIHVINSAARFRTATRSGTLADGFAQIQAPCDRLLVTLQALSTDWDRTIFSNPWHMLRCGSVTSFAGRTFLTNDYVFPLMECKPQLRCCFANTSILVTSPERSLLRPSNIFGAISRHRIAQVLEASPLGKPGHPARVGCRGRPRTVGMATSQRFHQDSEDHESLRRHGCADPIACGITTSAPASRLLFNQCGHADDMHSLPRPPPFSLNAGYTSR